MARTRHGRLSRHVRAVLARLSTRHKYARTKNPYDQAESSPPSTPPKYVEKPLSLSCVSLRLKGRSVVHKDADNEAMQTRLAELEMTEMENSCLRLQLDDLQRTVESMVEENKCNSHMGELHMADVENSSLRLQLECLRTELRRPRYGSGDVVDTRLAWLNVEAA